MTTQFNGVGFLNQPIQDQIPFITQFTLPQQYLYNILLHEARQFAPATANLNGFLNQFDVNNPLPQDTNSFVQAFVQFYNLASVYGNTNNAQNQVLSDIVNANEAAIETNSNTFFGSPTAQNQDVNPLINPIGSTIMNQPTFNQDMATRSFDDFLKTFNYNGNTAVGSSAFQKQWADYYARVANTRTNYLNLFTAFFANGTLPNGTTDFENALAAYITNIMYPPGGSTAAFLPSHNYGDFFNQLEQQYEKAISGSGAPYQTSIDPSVKGAAILNVIFDLVVKMISTLQIVTAAQSDRLKFLTQWQRSYTELEGQIHSFVKNGPEWIQYDDDSRNQLNQANQTYTQEIQARITVVNDDSKQLQTNVNQSNDNVNQQTSIATSIIQQLTSLLTSIYKS